MGGRRRSWLVAGEVATGGASRSARAFKSSGKKSSGGARQHRAKDSLSSPGTEPRFARLRHSPLTIGIASTLRACLFESRPIERLLPGMEPFLRDARKAILANDEAALRDAIRRGADVNGMIPCTNQITGARGLFPLLHLAAVKGLAGMCEILLAEGADAKIPSTVDGAVALHEAAHISSTACVPLLLRAGADVDARANDGATPLHSAAHYGNTACICLFLRAGADVNARGNDGTTPLHTASQCGHVDAAKLLIAAGANMEARTRRGNTPLRFAILGGQREAALTLLRAGAPITVLPTKWIKPKSEALQDHMVDIIDEGGWNARVERHRRPLMSILSNLALPQDAQVIILSFWSPPGGR